MDKRLSQLLIWLIQCYQSGIAPLFPPTCRHDPSCSQYARQAITLHGPWRGLRLTIKRLCSCHPWGKWGYDPVPQDPHSLKNPHYSHEKN